MKYAVIRLQGHQYIVSPKDEILVDLLGDKKPEAEVLLLVDDKKVEIGTPIVKNAKINLKVLGEQKGEKVHVRKYKAKSRYRKHIGFRPKYSKLLIANF